MPTALHSGSSIFSSTARSTALSAPTSTAAEMATGYTPIADSGGAVVEARPEYYGILLFTLAGQGTLYTTSLSGIGSLNITAYAVKTSSGGTQRHRRQQRQRAESPAHHLSSRKAQVPPRCLK